MIVKLNGRPADMFHGIGFMWSSDVFWIPGPNTTELSDDERAAMRAQYEAWCSTTGSKVNDDVIRDLNEPAVPAATNPYKQRLDSLVIESSLGFPVNADELSLINIECLMRFYDAPVMFRTARNDFVELNRQQLEIIMREIFTNRQKIMFEKWGDGIAGSAMSIST